MLDFNNLCKLKPRCFKFYSRLKNSKKKQEHKSNDFKLVNETFRIDLIILGK
jgi:hypothetical protein